MLTWGSRRRSRGKPIRRGIALHLEAGRVVTLDLLRAAVAEATAYSATNGRHGSVSTLTTALNKILLPARSRRVARKQGQGSMPDTPP